MKNRLDVGWDIDRKIYNIKELELKIQKGQDIK